MTRNDDIERVLEQWFTEGPLHMPDRLLDGTLERIDGLPKRRLADIGMRLSTMLGTTRLAAAAALVVVLAGIGLALMPRWPGIGATPTSTPAETTGPLPSALQAVWSSTRSERLTIDATTITIPAVKADIVSRAALVRPGTLEVRLETSWGQWDCPADAIGTYRFELSGDGAVLTLTPLGDACPARRAMLEGDWIHTDMGDLAPGKHVSALFRPFDPATGTLAYTVPAGWNELYEADAGLNLARVSTPDESGIQVLSNVSPYHEEGIGPLSSIGAAARCDETGGDVQRSAAAIATWLRTLPAFIASTPVPVSIGGLDGVIVDLAIAPGWINTCSYSEGSGPEGSTGPTFDTPAFTFAGPGHDVMLGLSSGERARYVILDRGPSLTLVIAVQSSAATWDAAVSAAMPVIESFEFTR